MPYIDTSKHLITLFQQQVKATPNAVALEDTNHSYSYAELNRKVDSLARRLRWRGVGQGDLVGILLPHTADFIIACLASLRAGGAYLIVELAYPPNLVNDVIQDANPPVLITYQSKVKEINSSISLVILDELETESEMLLYNGFSLPTEYDRDAVAFVSYSSGTTGRPKGIANHDRPGILSYDQRFAISDQKPGDRIACNTFFIWEMFRPLVRGATAFAMPDEISYDPVGLVELLASRRISETLMTPTLLASILAQFSDPGNCLPDLRVLWVTGEVVTKDLARRALRAFPEVRLLNSYSTAETWDTAIGDMKDILDDTQQSTYCSVGTPLGVNQIYVLDESGDRVDPGTSGEVFIGGPVLALGYLNLPKVTEETFVPDPFSSEPRARMYRSGDLGRILPSGALEITGRIGSMIKLRGYSIIPGKVQTIIVTHLAIRDCVVISHGEGLGQQLLAYFVCDNVENTHVRPTVEVDESSFSSMARRVLSHHLPAYMIPTYWVEVTKLPADPVSGKINMKMLPSPQIITGDTATNKVVKAGSADDIDVSVVTQIWASTLKIPPSVITPEHKFFDLGGHSLSLATLSANIAARFGFHIPVAHLVDPQTLQGHLATILAARDGKIASTQADLPATLRADCVLEEDIQPTETKICLLSTASVVLLTGSTGFLGAFLLHGLLRDTSATILCLVRCNDFAHDSRSMAGGRAKIRQSLLEKGLWRDAFMERIEAINGNLSRKHFGLPLDAFNQLASRVEIIIHAGAVVNLVYPYSALRAPNIGGTREILRLASLGGCTVQHISTNSVLPPSSPSLCGWSEDAKLHIDEVAHKLLDGYGQTKWVAEQLVIEAGRRGFPVKILRAGTIGGDSITGMSNGRDLLTALLVESVELGYAPVVKGWRGEMTPVDFVSQAILRLSDIDTSQLVYHLGEPDPISAADLFEKLAQLGYPTKPLDWDKWVALWTEKRGSIQSDNASPNRVLRSGVTAIGFLIDLAVLNNSATEQYLRDLKRPEITGSLLEVYTRHWFARTWISKPPSISSTQVPRAGWLVQMGPLGGRVAVVTGASSGIGAATALALAQEGVHVALAARRTEALESLASSLKPHGIKTLVHQTDVTDGAQVEALMRATAEQLGPIDILVSCAGVMYFTLMKNARKDEWERTVDVNCKGLLHCLSSTVPDMLSRGSGHIVAISSDAGRKVFAGLGVYSGSKFFIEATLQSLRLETAGTGLRVTSIQPGNVSTELLGLSTDKEAIEKYGEPSGAKVLDAEHVANAIIYALRQPEQVAVNEILIEPRDEPI